MRNKLLNKLFKEPIVGWIVGLVPVIIEIFFSGNEPMLIDARFWLRGETKAHDALVVVALDEHYKSNHKSPDPVGRDYLAALVDSLSHHGARVIVFDYAIRISDRADSINFVKFKKAIAKAENVVLPSLLNPGVRYNELLDVPAPEIRKQIISGYADLEGDHPLFIKNLIELDNSQVEPSLALAAVALYKERSQHQNDPMQGSANTPKIRDRTYWQTVLASVHYPVEADKTIPIHFFGKVFRENIRRLSSEWIFQREEKGPFPYEKIEDKLVLVGSTYADKSGDDTFQSPFGPMQGVEVHANIISNLLSEKYLEQPNWVVSLLLLPLSFAIGVFFHRMFSFSTGTVCLFLIAIFYITLAYLTFSFFQVLIPVARPIQAGFTGFFVAFIIRHYWQSADQAKP